MYHKHKNDKTEKARGLGRKTREIGKGNQMTALRLQTGEDIRHPQPPFGSAKQIVQMLLVTLNQNKFGCKCLSSLRVEGTVFVCTDLNFEMMFDSDHSYIKFGNHALSANDIPAHKICSLSLTLQTATWTLYIYSGYNKIPAYQICLQKG